MQQTTIIQNATIYSTPQTTIITAPMAISLIYAFTRQITLVVTALNTVIAFTWCFYDVTNAVRFTVNGNAVAYGHSLR